MVGFNSSRTVLKSTNRSRPLIIVNEVMTLVRTKYLTVDDKIVFIIIYYCIFVLQTSVVLIHDTIFSKEQNECTQHDATLQKPIFG